MLLTLLQGAVSVAVSPHPVLLTHHNYCREKQQNLVKKLADISLVSASAPPLSGGVSLSVVLLQSIGTLLSQYTLNVKATLDLK